MAAPRPASAGGRRRGSALARIAIVSGLLGTGLWPARDVTRAHTPITSPYTFTEHVLPIVRAHCGACHVKGGVAPMSLMTHADAVPWAESMRLELVAGHMPPWPADGPRARYRHAQGLSGRELNVLLTWATGGTPPGPDISPDVSPDAPPPAVDDAWRLGPPDVEIPLPAFALDAATQEATATFTTAVPSTPGAEGDRWLRAADLRPGTRSLVRAATITIVTPATTPSDGGLPDGRAAAVWLPGDTPVPFPDGTGIRVPPGSRLVVQLRYRKTWEHEREAMSDRSVLGLYFGGRAAASVRALALWAPGTEGTTSPQPLTFTREVDTDLRALAVVADPSLTDARATIDAVRPDGSQVNLLSLGPQRGWRRRYWFAEPITLPRGTRLVVRAQPETGAGASPAGTPRADEPLDPATVGFTLDVVPAPR